VKYENTWQPPIIPPGYNISVTKASAIFAVFWIYLYGFMFSTSLNLETYPLSVFKIMGWIIFGLVSGIITSVMITQSQLGRLSRDYKFSPNGKDLVLIIAPIILFFILGFFVSFSFSSFSPHAPVFQGFSISVYAWGVSIAAIRPVLFFAFERRENMRLMQSWFGSDGVGIILIPKAPDSNVDRTEINNKDKWKKSIRGWFPTEPALRSGRVNSKKSNIRIPKGPPTLKERVVGGLGAAGSGLILLAIVFYFVPIYSRQAIAIELIVGIALVAAAFIVTKLKGNNRN
jgi:hypothetical protein